jgi:hypothetical protein
VEYLSCTLQELGEELAKLQAEQRDQDATKRQLEECIAYQRSLGEEKELRAQFEEVQPKIYAWQSAAPVQAVLHGHLPKG